MYYSPNVMELEVLQLRLAIETDEALARSEQLLAFALGLTATAEEIPENQLGV
jgi:hypothetical protein